MKSFLAKHKNGVLIFLIFGTILCPSIITFFGWKNESQFPSYAGLMTAIGFFFGIALLGWTCLKNYIVLRFILRKNDRMHFGLKMLLWNTWSLITGYVFILLLMFLFTEYGIVYGPEVSFELNVPWYDVTNALSWAKPVIRMLGLLWMFLFGAAASYLFVLRKTEFSLIRKILYSLISALSALPVALMLGV